MDDSTDETPDPILDPNLNSTPLIKPLQSHDALLLDIRDVVASDSDTLHVWWLGQSGFLLQWRGKHLLFDPYLSDSLTRKYAKTDKPHVRMTELCIDPTKLDMIDVVTSSHNHTDHLDAETLEALFEANSDLKLVIPEANRAFVADRLGCDPNLPIGLTDGESVEVEGFQLHGVPAAHNKLVTDEQGRHMFMGYVATFGPWSVYHSGDTLLFDGLSDRLSAFDLDIVLLPINGSLPERRVAGNLWGDEAAKLAKQVGAGWVVPCHYDMFTFNTATPELFVDTCDKLGQDHRVLACGERLTLDRP